MGHPRHLFHLFSSFQTNITILTINISEKMSSSIRHWDLNQQPLEHESPPITSRPGLPPNRELTAFNLISSSFIEKWPPIISLNTLPPPHYGNTMLTNVWCFLNIIKFFWYISTKTLVYWAVVWLS